MPREPAPWAEAYQALLATKFSRPRVRPGVISRRALTDVLVSSSACPLVIISAPVGFGKSTLLAEWAELETRTFAWVSLDRGDDDPVALLGLIATAVGQVRPIDRGLFDDLASPGVSILGRIVPRLIASLRSAGEPFVLVLRNLQEVRSRDSRDAIDLLVDHLPPGVQIGVSSREQVWLATGGRRCRGEVLELGSADLAFDEDEAAQLLAAAGTILAPDEVEHLTKSTEGWAAGLYLSALAQKPGHPVVPRDAEVVHPFLSEYLQSEVLSRLPPDTISFLTRTAVLDTMCGSLCDAILGSTGSARLLKSLERSNLFLVPLDDRQEWYRYHTLFHAVLLNELVRREPDSVTALHLRAADWWEAKGSVDQTIRHSQAAEDPDRAARFVATQITPAYFAGRLPDVERWLRQLGASAIAHDPSLAVLAGWMATLTGRAVDAARWAESVEHVSLSDVPADGAASFESVRAMLRAFLSAHGVAAMASDAEIAVAQEPVWSTWRGVAVGLLAIARWLDGDPAAADVLFAEGIEAADTTGAWVLLSRLLALRALLSMDGGDWVSATRDVDRAKAVVDDAGLAEYGSSATVYAASARLSMHRNEIPAARAELLNAMRLRILVTWASPWSAVALRLEMASAHFALADPHGPQILLREIDEILYHRPQLGVLNDRVDVLRETLAKVPAVSTGSTLTTAELRLLPYLQTHLTLPEIGERLYVSRNTVSTESTSIYRKLGVSSRSGAVDRAREWGLLAASTLD